MGMKRITGRKEFSKEKSQMFKMCYTVWVTCRESRGRGGTKLNK